MTTQDGEPRKPGGPVPSGQAYNTNDDGPELFVPASRPHVTEDGFYVIPLPGVPLLGSQALFMPHTENHEPICGSCGRAWPCDEAKE